MTTTEGQFKFDDQGRVSCVASSVTERPQLEKQGDLFLAQMEAEALEAWHKEYQDSDETIIGEFTLALEAITEEE